MAKQLLLRLMFLLSSVFLTSAASTFQILINCGSSSDVSGFVGDDKTTTSGFGLTRKGKAVTNSSSISSTSDLYQTARVFHEASRYEFNVSKNNSNTTFLVRLHFFPFASKGEDDLASSTFNVMASSSSGSGDSGFTLLEEFTPRNSSSFPVIKEQYVFLGPEETNLRIFFVPAKGRPGTAFVNAMEILRLPEGYLSNNSSSGDGYFLGLLSYAYRNVYRVKALEGKVNDSYGREWTPDDDYFLNSSSTLSKSIPNRDLPLNSGEAFVEPDASYYKSCRYLEHVSSTEKIFWRFKVARRTRHLLRAHFCDIVEDANLNPLFPFYVNGNGKMEISVYESVTISSNTRVPFWKDYEVDSDDSGYLNVSIGTGDKADPSLAFLNGLEIMEFVEKASLSQDLMNMKDDEPGHKFPSVVVVSVVCALVVISLLVLVLVLVWRMRRRSKRAKTRSEPMDQLTNGRGRSRDSYHDGIGSVSPIPNLNLNLKMAFGDILAATNNFEAKLLIGEGGFGKVYKGTLRDGTKVAVKRSDSSHGQGLPEFRTEVIVLSKIRHKNLVSLVGYCDEGSEMILVYEYMEKGTLREHLYNWKDDMKLADRKSELDWTERLEICLGSAKGLHYLHTGSDGGIIHRDVKSTNILLDEYLVAKVADFGLSQAGPQDPEHFSTGVKGSFGYLDPEYFRTLQLTDKSDVYSFGVVLLEVLCARPPIMRSARKEEINLAEWGLHWLMKGELEKIIDPSLAGQIKPSSLRKFGEIAEKCLRPDGADRPSMLDVCWDLEYALQLQKTAAPRAPHDDTTTGGSSNLILPDAEGLSTVSIDVDLDGPLGEGEEDSQMTDSGVFSQLNVNGGR